MGKGKKEGLGPQRNKTTATTRTKKTLPSTQDLDMAAEGGTRGEVEVATQSQISIEDLTTSQASIEDLDDEVLINIFTQAIEKGKLDDLLPLLQESEKWNRLSKDESLWENVVLKIRSTEHLKELMNLSIPVVGVKFSEGFQFILEDLEKIDLSKLKKITLRYCQHLTDQGLIDILKSTPNLEKLDLWGTQITAEGLEGIKLSKLRKLTLRYCQKLTDQGLIDILDSTPNLEKLDLLETRITAEGLKGINLSKLRKINLNRCKNLTKQDIKYIIQSGPNLESVHAFGNRIKVSEIAAIRKTKEEMGDERDLAAQGGARRVTKQKDQTTRRNKTTATIPTQDLDMAAEGGTRGEREGELEVASKTIEDLTTSQTSIEDLPDEMLMNIFTQAIEKGRVRDLLPLLQVSKRWNRLAKDKDLWKDVVLRIRNIEDLKKILNLSTPIGGVRFSDDFEFILEDLENIDLSKLKKIDLGYCRSLTDQVLRRILSSSPNLEELGVLWVDQGLKGIKLSKLRKLTLRDCEELRNQGLIDILNSASNLEELDLSEALIAAEGLEGIDLSKLRKLTLRECQNLTGQDLGYILSCASNLEELDLSKAKINAVEPKDIKLSKLRKINFNFCLNLTDQDLRGILNSTPNLEELDLGYTHITAEGLKGINLSKLRKINLPLPLGVDLITEQNIVYIIQLAPNLESIDVFGSHITVSEIIDIRKTKEEMGGERDLAAEGGTREAAKQKDQTTITQRAGASAGEASASGERRVRFTDQAAKEKGNIRKR